MVHCVTTMVLTVEFFLPTAVVHYSCRISQARFLTALSRYLPRARGRHRKTHPPSRVRELQRPLPLGAIPENRCILSRIAAVAQA